MKAVHWRLQTTIVLLCPTFSFTPLYLFSARADLKHHKNHTNRSKKKKRVHYAQAQRVIISGEIHKTEDFVDKTGLTMSEKYNMAADQYINA